jgi:hypothetical protein
MTCPYDAYIQKFTFVHPSELRLARVVCLVQTRLGHFGQLHTGPLPAWHVPDSDRVEHYSELSITTPLKRLRVAPLKGHYQFGMSSKPHSPLTLLRLTAQGKWRTNLITDW